MKHLTLVATTLVLCVPMLAQPDPGDPVQLRNPHRRYGFGGGGGFRGDGNGFAGDGNGFGAQGGGMQPFGQGGNAVPLPPGNGYYSGNPPVNGGNPANVSPPPPPVSMFVDGPYLFILRGDTLMQFDKKTLKLINSVELPRPTPPASTQGDVKTFTAPPLRPGIGFRVEPSFKLEPFDPTAIYNFDIGPTF